MIQNFTANRLLTVALAALALQTGSASASRPSGSPPPRFSPPRPSPAPVVRPPSMRDLLPTPAPLVDRNRLPSPPFVPVPPARPLLQLVPGPLGIGNPITDHGVFIPRGNGGIIIEVVPNGGGATIVLPFRMP